MISFRTDDVREFDLVSDLHQGDVFYDEGGVYVRSQTVNGHPLIVSDMGLMCTIEEIEHAFKMNGRVPKLVRCQGCGAMLAFNPFADEVHEFDLCAGDVFEAGNEVFLVTLSGDFSLVVVDALGRRRSVAECEYHLYKKHVVPVMLRSMGVRLCRS